MSYTPLFLSNKTYQTYTSVIETFIQTNGHDAVSPELVAQRMDNLFSRVNHPQLSNMTQVFKALDAYSIYRKLRPFRKLKLKSREKIIMEIQDPGAFWLFIERIPGITGISKDLIRGLNVLSTVGYYSHPLAKKQVGYVPFNERNSTIGKDQKPATYQILS